MLGVETVQEKLSNNSIAKNSFKKCFIIKLLLLFKNKFFLPGMDARSLKSLARRFI